MPEDIWSYRLLLLFLSNESKDMCGFFALYEYLAAEKDALTLWALGICVSNLTHEKGIPGEQFGNHI